MPQTRREIEILRFVIDTNVWFDAHNLGRKSNLAQDRQTARDCLLKACEHGTIIRSDATERDIAIRLEKMTKSGAIPEKLQDAILSAFYDMTERLGLQKGYVTTNYQALNAACKDKNDWPFLILADMKRAYAIISRDNHLLKALYKKVRIISVQEFLDTRLPSRHTP